MSGPVSYTHLDVYKRQAFAEEDRFFGQDIETIFQFVRDGALVRELEDVIGPMER